MLDGEQRRFHKGECMISRRQFIRYSLGMAILGWGGVSMAKSSSLRFGTLPVVSIRRAYEIYSPLLDYFKKTLKQPISLETPPNFRSMYQRIIKNDFDLLISPPHIARLAQKKLGWHPLVMCQPGHHSELLVMGNGGPGSLDELRGETIAVLDKSALVVMIMLDALEQKGLVIDRDFRVIETRSYESSEVAVKQGIAKAMIARSQGILGQDDRNSMKVLLQAGTLPGYVFIAAPSVSQRQQQLLQKHLLSFSRTPEGASFLPKLGYESFTQAGESVMKQLDPYLKATEASLL
jgi:phosphonate transport system substrate-binding protein